MRGLLRPVAAFGVAIASVGAALTLVASPAGAPVICVGETLPGTEASERPGRRVTVIDDGGRAVPLREGGTIAQRPGRYDVEITEAGRTSLLRVTVTGCTPPRPRFVEIDADSGGGAVVGLENAAPGDETTGCVVVRYRGTLPAEVRLFGAPSAGRARLAPFLQVTVEHGLRPPTLLWLGKHASCEGFVPEGTLFRGRLSDLPTTWRDGLIDRSEHPLGVWLPMEERAYRITVRLQGGNHAQGLAAVERFVWEARDPLPEAKLSAP